VSSFPQRQAGQISIVNRRSLIALSAPLCG
jgi:hypothetical protein